MSAGTATHELAVIDYDPFAEVALSRVVATTEPQREVWLAAQLGTEASLAYNESISLRLVGRLDVEALRLALQDLLQRHEALRATISDDGLQLMVAATSAIDLPLTDLSHLAAAARDSEVAAVLQSGVEEPFDLQHGPLLRARLLQLAEQDHLLVICAHHIVCDGWSFGVIVGDLANLYAQRSGRPHATDVAAESFADYAIAQSAYATTAAHAAAESYWLGRFADSVPVLDLPTDRPRGAIRTFRSRRMDRTLDGDLIEQVRVQGGRHGASLFAALLAGFAATLSRVAGADELVLGVPFAGQSVDGQDRLVGHCVNLLPVRVALAADASLPDNMKSVQGVLFDAFDHPQYTFGSLLKKLSLARDPSRPPLVNVMFNLDRALDPNVPGFPGLVAECAGNARSYENFDLFVNAVQVNGALRLECQYNADLFDGATVGRWLACYETLLRDACARPEQPVGRLAFASAADRTQIAAWNATQRDFRTTALIHALVEEQAARNPERTAVVCGDARATYADIDHDANRIARQLQALGVVEGSLVGLHVERDIGMIAAMLGVLKAGAAYVPLDPAYPAERLRFMAEDAGLAALVTMTALADVLHWPLARTLVLDAQSSPQDALSAAPLPAPRAVDSAAQVAYVIYTSGSTGKPKGVQVAHRSVVNFLESMAHAPGLVADDRLLAVTTLSFDIAVTELWLPLCVGAQIVLASRTDAGDGALLRKLLDEHEITVMQATPATWRLLLEAEWPGAPGFKALCGGEALTADLARELRARTAALWNMYGPTETTVWSTCARIDDATASIGIGRPIANTSVWILDERRELCPLGVPGEICIGGEGVAMGYLHRPELTAERFIPDSMQRAPGARLYCTGDRGRWRADGMLEHLGRLDFQVKVRGYRIELGEIEAGLLAYPGVARAVVITREEQPGDVRLVAYVVAATGTVLADASLVRHLQQVLPDYMIPQHLVVLPSIPLLPNGKVNRHGLPAPFTGTADAGHRNEFVAPQNAFERQIVAELEAVLNLDGLGMHDDFFRLGGHSLLAARLIARLNKAFQVQLPLRTAFQFPTASLLAEAIDLARHAGAPHTFPPIERQADQTRAPLTLSQARIRFMEEMYPGLVTYNTPSAHRLRGTLHAEAFDRAWREVVARQDALRIVIASKAGEHEQLVTNAVAASLLPIEDLAQWPSAEREAELMRRLDALIAQPFDLARGPLFTARLFRLDHDHHVFFFLAHHIVWDGWSFDLLYEEVAAAYAAALEGRGSPLPALAVSYVDYAHWSNRWLASDACRTQVAYWQRQFANGRTPHEIPTDFPRKPGMSGHGATDWLRVDRGLTERLHDVARRADATLNMVTLAAFAVMLHATAQSRDLTLGIPVRGRPLPELDPIMGFFNNLLPLRFEVDPARQFVDWIREVKQVAIRAFAHQDVPFERLVQEVDALRDTRASGYYQALFSFQDARERNRSWGGLRQETILVFQQGATEDLGLWLMEGPAGLEGGVTYNTDLFQPATAALLRTRYLRLLQDIATRPTATIASLLAIGAAEQDEVDVALTPSTAVPLPQRLRDRTRADGLRGALRYGSRQWTLAELAEHADRIAGDIHHRAPHAQRIVVAVADPMLRVAAWLAVWQLGATCVMPAEASFGAEARVDAIVGELPCGQRDALAPPRIDVQASGLPLPHPVLEPQRAALEIMAGDASVPVDHCTLARLAAAFAERIRAGDGDGWLVDETLPDPTVCAEVMAALVAGGSVCFVSAEEARDGDQLRGQFASLPLRIAHLTPNAWRALLDSWWTTATPLEAIVDGAEAAPELAAAMESAGCSVWAAYRPSAIPMPVALARHLGGTPMHLGTPLLPQMVRVRDPHGNELPVGVPGRLHVRFDDGRTHDTGDVGRWRADGCLLAADEPGDRLRLQGHRVSLDAVEARLKAWDAVAECVAVVREERPGDRRLDLYVVPAAGATVAESEVRNLLLPVLPRSVRVNTLSILTSVPRLADGRPDREALRARVIGGAAQRPAPSTPTEVALAEVWSGLLGVPQIDLADNFFDLGGSSLLAMQAVEQIAQRTGKRISPRRYVFESLAQLALAYDSDAPAAEEAAPVAAPVKRGLFGMLGGMLKRGY